MGIHTRCHWCGLAVGRACLWHRQDWQCMGGVAGQEESSCCMKGKNLRGDSTWQEPQIVVWHHISSICPCPHRQIRLPGRWPSSFALGLLHQSKRQHPLCVTLPFIRCNLVGSLVEPPASVLFCVCATWLALCEATPT